MPASNSRLVSLLVLLLCGCRVGDKTPPEMAPREAFDSTAAHGTGQPNPFDPSAVAPGDSVLGLRIASMDVQPSLVDSNGWAGTVQFEGKRILSGAYRRHPFDSELDELCFFPNTISARKLPIFPNDERTTWLCFTNQNDARARLGRGSDHGVATIEIDRYLYYYSHSDVYNTARLLDVISLADSLGSHELEDSTGVETQ